MRLEADGVDADRLLVRRVRGVEALGAPSEFLVDLEPEAGYRPDLAGLPGAVARLFLEHQASGQREVAGVIDRCERLGKAGGGELLRVSLVSRLALLGLGRDRRIFQDLDPLAVAREVLDRAGLPHRSATEREPARRDYLLQFDESPLDFLGRIAGAEGITYRVDSPAGGDEVVFCEGAGAWEPIEGDPALPVRLPTEAPDEEHLTLIRQVQRAASAAVALRDFDFENPAAPLEEQASSGEGAEDYRYPGGFLDPGEGQHRARVRLEAIEAGAATFEGAAHTVRLAPGRWFELEGYPSPSRSTQLVVLQVRTQWEDGGEGHAARPTCAFVARERSAPFRPRAERLRARAPGLQTAVVVGPAGEDIHLDAHGRIRVQFHWDRQGQRDERSTCWIRLQQAWAGGTMGAVVVPRLGQEVVVRFLESDPDRPVVVGAVYDGSKATPVQLPEERTQSTQHSQTTPGGDGWNELTFEDQAGEERLQVRAQRDEELETLRDKRQQVRAQETLQVDGDRSQTVGGDQSLRVARQDISRVVGRQSVTVGGDLEAEVAGLSRRQIGIAETRQVGGERVEEVSAATLFQVGAAAALSVGGGLAIQVGGVQNLLVGGLRAAQVGGDSLEVSGQDLQVKVAGACSDAVGGASKETLGGSDALSVKGDATDHAGGARTLLVAQRQDASAASYQMKAQKITLRAGEKASITMGADGIKVSGTDISIEES